jgi:hypothetical protein
MYVYIAWRSLSSLPSEKRSSSSVLLSWDFELTYTLDLDTRAEEALPSCTWYAIREGRKKMLTMPWLLAARGEKQDGTPPLPPPPRAPSPPLDGRPRDRLPMTSVTSREVPSGWKGLRLATTFPVPVVTSRQILITYTSLSTGIALFRKKMNHYSEPVVLRSVRRSPPIRMPKGGSLAYLFDGTEVRPVSLPPSGNTQLGGKKSLMNVPRSCPPSPRPIDFVHLSPSNLRPTWSTF